MTNRNPIIRPVMTAIAAVLACSSPSFAQSADPPAAETPAPVVAAPVAPAPVAPAPVTTAPIVPDTPVAADTLAPAEAVPAPAARRATTTRPSAARSRPAPARAARAAPAAAPVPAAAIAPPVAEAPVVEPLPAPPEAAPVVAPVEAADTSSMDGMMLPLAAGGLAILVLAGVGLALRRRKRHAAEADEQAMRDAQLDAIDDSEPAMVVEPEPEPRPDPVTPAFVAAPALATKAAPVAAESEPSPEIDGPVTELPEDFDLSRFSPQVQAAYKGPTEDNPSLSLKNRLRRANGLDKLAEREAEDVAAAPAQAPAAAGAARGDFMLTQPGKKTAMRPAYTPAKH